MSHLKRYLEKTYPHVEPQQIQQSTFGSTLGTFKNFYK